MTDKVLKVGHVTKSRDLTFLVLLSFVVLHGEYNNYVSYPTFWHKVMSRRNEETRNCIDWRDILDNEVYCFAHFVP